MTDATQAELTALYRALMTAWNERDASAYASLCSPAALVVGFDGSQMSGAQVPDRLASIFADHPTPPYVCQVRAVRLLTPDVGMVTAIAGMRTPGRQDLNPDLNAVHCLVAARTKTGDWRIELFQNTPAAYHGQPELTAQHVAELSKVGDGAG